LTSSPVLPCGQPLERFFGEIDVGPDHLDGFEGHDRSSCRHCRAAARRRDQLDAVTEELRLVPLRAPPGFVHSVLDRIRATDQPTVKAVRIAVTPGAFPLPQDGPGSTSVSYRSVAALCAAAGQELVDIQLLRVRIPKPSMLPPPVILDVLARADAEMMAATDRLRRTVQTAWERTLGEAAPPIDIRIVGLVHPNEERPGPR
jgi:hypothetical protein